MCFQGPDQLVAQAVGFVAGLRAAGQAPLLLVGEDEVSQQTGSRLQQGQVQDLSRCPVSRGRVSDLRAAEELLLLTCSGDQIECSPPISIGLLQES